MGVILTTTVGFAGEKSPNSQCRKERSTLLPNVGKIIREESWNYDET